MSTLRGSAQYIWDTKKPIGQGATSIVCIGRNKKSGKQVAVKSFTAQGNHRPHNIKIREFEVLRKVEHENIVTLLAIEEEQSSKSPVIVMELCTGGSVHSMLDKHTHKFGLNEDEFLLFLKHIASGIKHLRDKGIVHRDIKPGNILRYISDDGSAVYKLTDFGAARELPDGDVFSSICGTEEFLHPAMFERGVLRGDRNKLFTAIVDLWSLGVTIYHVATGYLPFRPFGGKENRMTMYKITTTKESGVISGHQPTEGGDILWSKELPKSCILSFDLQRRLVPMLAGLLEIDQSKCWNFDTFFARVNEIVESVLIHLYSPKTFQLTRLYMDPNSTLPALHRNIAEHTNITPDSQLLFYENKPLAFSTKPSQPLEKYSISFTQEKPVIVIDTMSHEQVEFQPSKINSPPKFTSNASLDTDPNLAKNCVANMMQMERQARETILKQRLTHDAVNSYVSSIHRNIERLQQVVENAAVYASLEHQRLRSTSGHLKQILTSITKNHSTKNCNSVKENIERAEAIDVKLSKIMEAVRTKTKTLEVAHLKNCELLTERWNPKLGCCPENRCLPAMEVAINEAITIEERFKQDRNLHVPRLPYNDEQVHKFEKNNLYLYWTKARTKLKSHCLSNSILLHNQYHAWSKHVSRVQADIHDIELSLQDTYWHSQRLSKAIDQASTNIIELLSESGDALTSDLHIPLCVDGAQDEVRSEFAINADSGEKSCFYLVKQDGLLGRDMANAKKSLSHFMGKTDELKAHLHSNNSLFNSILHGDWPRESSELSSVQSVICSPLPFCEKREKNGYSFKVEEENRLIQSLRANNGLADYINSDGWTVLHYVAFNGLNTDNISLLINDIGLDVNVLTNDLATPLHLSCINGSLKCVEVLMQHGADVNCIDSCGRSPLMYACLSRHEIVVNKLLKDVDVTIQDSYGNTCLHYSAIRNLPETLAVFMQFSSSLSSIVNNHGETCLHIASNLGHLKLVEYLLSREDVDVNVTDFYGNTALHFASRSGNSIIVKNLLSHCQINVNKCTLDGFTPLMYACKHGQNEIVKLLLQNNRISCNMADQHGYTPIMHAASGGHFDVVDTFMKTNFVITMRDSKNRTVMHIACQKHDTDIICLLFRHKHAKSAINVADVSGKTVLHELVSFANLELVKTVLDLGANHEVLDSFGRTAKAIAVSAGNDPVADHLYNLQQKHLV